MPQHHLAPHQFAFLTLSLNSPPPTGHFVTAIHLACSCYTSLPWLSHFIGHFSFRYSWFSLLLHFQIFAQMPTQTSLFNLKLPYLLSPVTSIYFLNLLYLLFNAVGFSSFNMLCNMLVMSNACLSLLKYKVCEAITFNYFESLEP